MRVPRYQSELDLEMPLWAIPITLYGFGLRLLNNRISLADTAIATLEHVGIAIGTAAAVFLLSVAVRRLCARRRTASRILATYRAAPIAAFSVFFLLILAQLAPALSWNFVGGAHLFYLPYVMITSSIFALGTFFYLRNLTLRLAIQWSDGAAELEDRDLDRILELKRTLLAAGLWLLGFFLMGFILIVDKVEPVLVGTSGIWSVLWFLSGMALILASAYSVVVLRMMEEYELTRYHRADERHLLAIAAHHERTEDASDDQE